MAIPKRYENIDFRPTEAMARNAERGLDSRREFGRGGTSVGVARARDIKNRVNLSPETVRRMFSFFSRQEVNKKAEGFSRGEDGYPSAGRIAWDLWGGDEGFTWSRERTRQMKTADANVKETRIGNLVARLREDAELTQEQAAAELPITSSTLGQIERGEIVTPSEPVIEAMAELYGATMSVIEDALREGAEPLEEVSPNGKGNYAMPSLKDISDAIINTYKGIAESIGGSVTPEQIQEIQTKLVKSLGDGKVGGNLVLFTNPSSPDLTGEYFDKDTNYGVKDGDVLYIDVEHSTNGMVKNVPIGHTTVKFTDVGIALDGQLWLDSFFDGDKYIEDLLRKRADYELLIKKHGFDRVRKFVATVADHTYKLLQEKDDALGWSSEVYEKSEPVRVKNNNTTYIKEWLIEKATLTPRPAEPRNAAFVKSIDEAIIELKEDNSMTDIQELDNEAELLPDVEETVEPTVEERLATLEAVSLKQHNDSQAHIKSLEGKIERLEAVVKAKSLATGAPRTSTKTRHDLLRDILNSTPASAKGVSGYEVSDTNAGVERAKSATVKTEAKRKGGRTMPSRGR